MESIIASALGLASEIMKLVNTKESLQYIPELEQAQMSLAKEQQKGYDADDAKIEALHAQIGVLLQAVNHVFQAYCVQNGSTVAPPPAASK